MVFLSDEVETYGIVAGSTSVLIYPILVVVSFYLTRNSVLATLSRANIMIRSLLPLLSLFPWILGLIVSIGILS
jgi:hypothetical protein